LTNYQNVAWTVSTALVEATTDTLSSWQTGTDAAGNGHWLVSGLTLTSAQTNTVYVRVTVNGSVKTTNGITASGSNGYATLTVVP
jgi:hypothetical protein